ncbi:MAG: glycoside hydrolase family 36 N-terminal domain-containing protein [Eubacteriaceae bacterium]
MQTITIDTQNTTYQMGVTENGTLLHLYYGARADGDMSYALTSYDRGFSGSPYDAGDDRTFSLDVLPQEYPVYGTGDYRAPALNFHNAEGTQGCDLRYRSHRFQTGKYQIEGLSAVYADDDESQTLEILLEDQAAGVEVTLRYGILQENDVITRSAVIRNTGETDIILDKAFSSSLDFLSGSYDWIHFDGRHGMERIPQREAVTTGRKSIGSIRGTSSHQYNPFIMITGPDTTEDHGDCWGMSFLYSGNFKSEAEKDQFGLTRIGMGLQDEMFNYPLAPGEVLETPDWVTGLSTRKKWADRFQIL